MLSWLWGIFNDPGYQAALTRLGAVILAAAAGVAVVVRAIWAIVKFRAERNNTDEKKGGITNITNSGQGFVSGGNTNINAPVTFGLDEKEVQRNIFDAQKPLTEEVKETNSLIQQLIALHHTPATPGEEKRIGEAVQSIAQGAADGDSRLQQALELLKSNKIAEATQLLSAFAEDKRARIDKEGSGDCLPQPRRHCGSRRPEAGAGGLRERAGARSGRSGELTLGRLDSSITATSIKRKPGLSVC
jgi:hypothetical protein